MVQQLKPPFVQNPRPKSVCVIGGGVAGIAALRALVEENGVKSPTNTQNGHSNQASFERVELLERRDNIGGVWYLNDECVQLEKSFKNGTANDQWPIINRKSSSEKRFWPSPAYPALRGNVLPKFLSFSGTSPFPPPASSEESLRKSKTQIEDGKIAADPFPTLAETHSYLERIAKPLRPHIRCNTEVVSVHELPHPQDASKNVWAVRIRDWQNGGVERTEYWDAVVVSVGWTDQPIYPRIEGIKEAREAGFIEHCKWYRGPEPYDERQRVVVVGNGNSGNDVCAQLASRRTPGKHEPVYRICRHKAWFFYVSLPDPMIRDTPAIQQLVVRNMDGEQKLDIHLIDGNIIKDVDRVILASGYEIGKIPFVRMLDRDLTTQEAKLLPSFDDSEAASQWTPSKELQDDNNRQGPWRSISDAPYQTSFDDDGHNPPRISGLFWHFLHERASTLALVNLTVTSIPFWTSDFQSHCIRAIWDGSYRLPLTIEDRRGYETQRLSLIRKLHEEKVENERKAIEAWEKRKQDLAAGRKDGEVEYEAPDHIFLLPYHILGTMVGDYFPGLRKIAVEGHPEWNEKLPIFEEVHELHDGMYGQKRETLMAKRALFQAREAKEEGFQQNGLDVSSNEIQNNSDGLDLTK